MNSLWSKLSDLPVSIESTMRSADSLEVSPVFTRHTTTLQLYGEGESGYGEDVAYETVDQKALQAAEFAGFAGKYTLAEFSDKLGEMDLFFGTPPVRETSRDYRRWTFESAALDLALRQNGLSLAAALGRTPRPVSYVVSLSLGRPPSLTPLRDRLHKQPNMQIKVDADAAWNEGFCCELAATGAIRTVDLKGYYSGTTVDLAADAKLYQLVVSAFPDAWIEDPLLNAETLPVLTPHADRLSFDAPIHRVEDLAQFAIEPRCINVKPSRSGRVKNLLELYEHCEQHSITMYAGGQFELGVGRLQVQQLASLFHPDGPNDCSPVSYHTAKLDENWPTSPLPLASPRSGFATREPRS